MQFRMQSTMPVERDLIWRMLADPAVFQRVTSPVMRFRSRNPASFPGRWEEGHSYSMDMFLLGVFPLGFHTIRFRSIDDRRMVIATNESGRFIRFWNHTMQVSTDSRGRTSFQDELVIHNGWLTLLTVASAYLFFLYRHWRMRRLVKLASTDN